MTLYRLFVKVGFYLLYCFRSPPSALPPVKNSIVLQSAKTISRKIREEEVTSETVVRAFIQRAKEVNPQINAIVDDCFEQALKFARKADQELIEMKRSGMTLQEVEKAKPLLGVPFTAKETVQVQGMSNSGCLTALKGRKAEADAEVIEILKNAGAIIIGVTNVPELSHWVECNNLLHGRTSSPYNEYKSSGGSSGGEGLRPRVSVVGPLCRHAEDIPYLLEIMSPKAKGMEKKVSTVSLNGMTVWWANELSINWRSSPPDKRLLVKLQDALRFLKSKGATIKKWPMEYDDLLFHYMNKYAEEFKGQPPLTYNFGGRKETLGDNSVLLSPVNPNVGPYHNFSIFTPYDFYDTIIFNILESPATSVPVGLTKDKNPLGLQVASAPNNDHLCLAVAKALEEQYGGWVCP